MAELSEHELAGFCAGSPAIDTDVVSRPRRQRLTVYRELLAPLNVSSFVTNVWPSRFGAFGFHFARARPSRSFSAREISFLARVAPCIKLGQALLAAEHRQPSAPGVSDWWASAWRLSPRETEVARLAARGFNNPEIGELLGASRNTVRNQLASIFLKADVSSRAELVFVMTEPLHAPSRRAGSLRREGAWRAFVASRGRRFAP
jgi:DNA-binding CsgD family transcriptional regulator